MSRPIRLLFVCTGNTCRSPLAEAVARKEAEERGWSHVHISSAGISTLRGLPPSEGARAVAPERGLDLEEHRSSTLTRERVREADLILGMTPGHVEAAESMGGAGKSFLLGAFAVGKEGEEDEGVWAVPDPYGGDEVAYRETLETLARLVAGVLDRLEGRWKT